MSRRLWVLTAFTALLSSLLMAACGGGGDDTPLPTSYAARMAWAQLLSAQRAWTMTGAGPNAQAFTITLAFDPIPDGPFPVNGTTAKRTQETVTVSSAGQTNTLMQTIYLDRTSLAFIGFDVDGACSVATSNAELPLNTLIGASGPVFSLSDLEGCTSGAIAAGTTSSTWSLEIDTGLALLCWNLISKDLVGVQNGSTSTCIEINANGSLGSRARFALTALGVEIKARNF